MKLIQHTPVTYYLKPKISRFTCIDVGCGYNGIDDPLMALEEKLIAYGFDSNVTECERLNKLNTNSNIKYIPGNVKLDSKHPFASGKQKRDYWTNNPWSHLAVAQSQAALKTRKLSDEELTRHNLWSSVGCTSTVEDIILDSYLTSNGINNIDLCKIDVDGPDFEILQSLEQYFQERKILSVVIEVNYFGSENEYDHSFHNVDRYLRRFGFDLYGLTINKYSARALPFPYYYSGPGENTSGRPYQGDALYILDPFNPHWDSDSLLKLILIFSLFNLPDWAAELVNENCNKLQKHIDIADLLNILTQQIQQGNEIFSDYENYMTAFNSNNSYFYSGSAGPAVLDKMQMQEINKLRFELKALKESTSWKITAPFRYIFDCLNKK